jgi:hypothetical protein
MQPCGVVFLDDEAAGAALAAGAVPTGLRSGLEVALGAVLLELVGGHRRSEF